MAPVPILTWQRSLTGLLLPVLALVALLGLGKPGADWYFALMYPAVFLAAWIAGSRVGIAATAIAAVASHWLVAAPALDHPLTGSSGLLPLAVFVASGIGFSWMQKSLRMNRRMAEILRKTRENDLRWRFVLEAAQQGFWETHFQSGEVRLSPRYREMLGFAGESQVHVGRFEEFIDDVHPDDLPALHEAVESHSAGDSPFYRAEFRLRHRDGHYVWIESRGMIVERDARGRPLRMMGSHVDISANKEALRSIAKGRRKLEAAFESMNDGVALVDPDGQIVEFNTAFARFYRFEDREALVRSFAELRPLVEVYTLDGTQVGLDQRFVNRALRGEAGVEQERRLRRTDTREEWFGSFNFAPIRDEASTIVGAVLVARDVTGRKRLEAEMDARTRALNEAQRLAQVSNWRWIRATDAIETGDEFRRMFGRDTVPPFSRAGGVLATERTWRELTAALEAAMQADGRFQMESRALRADGSSFWARLRGEAERGADGRLIGMFGTIQDISEERAALDSITRLNQQLAALNASLSEAKEAAEQASQAKTAFLSSVSHHLRTPLNSVIGFSELLLTGAAGNVTDEQRRQLMLILQAGKNQLALVSDMLDVTTIEAGKLRIERTAVSLRNLLADTVEELEPQATERGLKLALGLPAGDLCALADPGRLRQVVGNLVHNAIKFTDTGTVTIDTVELPGRVQIRITDTGIGIDDDHVDLLFRPFAQIHDRARLRCEGTGLGLAISRQLMKAMDGSISVDSRPGVGSCFSITLPTAAAAWSADARLPLEVA